MNIFPDIFKSKPLKKAKPIKQENLILDNGRIMPIILKPNVRSKNMRLRLDKDFKKIIITLSPKIPLSIALKFAHENKGWIEKQLDNSPNIIPFIDGGNIPVFGVKTFLKIIPIRTKSNIIKLENNQQCLTIPTHEINFATKTKIILKKLALEAAKTHLKILAPKLNRVPENIRITDTKSRWGSCTSDGIIALNWRLVCAPPDVFHYVIAHEIAHLKEMNHSPKFWAETERLMPNYKPHKDWLKKNGAMLHMIGSE